MAIRFQDGGQLFEKIRNNPLVSKFRDFFRRDEKEEEKVDTPKFFKEPEKEEKIPWQKDRKVIASLEKGLDIDTRNATTKWQDVVNRHFGNDEMVNALNVMFKESSGRPDIIHPNKNGSKDYGLMQINDIHAPAIKEKFGYDMDDLLDPEKNLEVARWIWEDKGWQPWVGAKVLGLVI